MLSKDYAWLQSEPGPKMLLEALNLYGTLEIVGAKHNKRILDWADSLGIGSIYNADETPWCGLFMGICAMRAGKSLPLSSYDILRALKWQAFGVGVKNAALGDVLIFQRPGGGHVGLYVGEDKVAYHVLGGNQGNCVCITRIEKSRCVAIRRPHYTSQPTNVRRIELSSKGAISTDES